MQLTTTQQALLTRVREIGTTVDAIVDNRKASSQVYHLVGEATELAMKAAIMRRHNWVEWPREHYTHNLTGLLDLLDVDHTTLPTFLRASLKTVLNWRRANAFRDMQFSRAQAKAFGDAAFGPNGVIPWLAKL